MTNALGGELLSKQTITLAGHPGREFRVKRPQGITTVRLFPVNQRLYQLMATSPGEDVGADARARFMNSFRLLSRS